MFLPSSNYVCETEVFIQIIRQRAKIEIITLTMILFLSLSLNAQVVILSRSSSQIESRWNWIIYKAARSGKFIAIKLNAWFMVLHVLTADFLWSSATSQFVFILKTRSSSIDITNIMIEWAIEMTREWKNSKAKRSRSEWYFKAQNTREKFVFTFDFLIYCSSVCSQSQNIDVENNRLLSFLKWKWY